MKRTGIFTIIALGLLTSCINRPDKVLSDKEMAPVVADLQLAEAYAQSHTGMNGTKREELVEYVLQKHGVTREEFDSTMSWYGRNIDDYQKLYALVDKELVKSSKRLNGASGGASGSTDLWPYRRMALISEKSQTNALDFSILSPYVEKGDRLKFSLRMRMPVKSTVLLGVEYDNGSMEYTRQDAGSKRKVEISLQTDSSFTVKRIFGNLLVADSRDLPLWIDSIYMNTAPYDSLEYYRIHSQRVYRGPQKRPKKVIQDNEQNMQDTINGHASGDRS